MSTEVEIPIAVKKVTRDFAGYYAPEKLGKTRRVTPEGYLVLEGTPIARLGTQIYAAHEHPDLVPDGAGNIIVERLPEEVFAPESLASFEGKDYVINHPPDGVHAVNWKQFTVGHVQNIRRGEGIEDDLVLGDIIVKDPEGIEYVNKHLPENSAGYNADYEQVAPGRAIQRNIRGNHVAAVTAGRAGARVSVRDHLTPLSLEDAMSKKTFWSAFRDGLTTLGVRTEDAAKMEAELKSNTLTTDNTGDDIGEKLEGLSNDVKAVKDWMAARDAKDAADAKAVKDAADAKAVKDAADAKAIEDAKSKEVEAEKTGDTLIEAESPGTVINMGRMWKGALTGDAASPEPVLQAVIARAEILAPGIQKITADSIVGNKGTVLASFMRTALIQHATTDVGRSNIATFTTDAPAALKGNDLIGVFNGVAQLARAQNNRAVSASSSARRMTGDFSKPKSVAELNKSNAEYWEKRSKG